MTAPAIVGIAYCHGCQQCRFCRRYRGFWVCMQRCWRHRRAQYREWKRRAMSNIKVRINKSGGRTWEIRKPNGELRILH